MNEPVYLRALEASDLDRVHEWHNDRELYELLGGPYFFVSKTATQSWLERKTGFKPFPPDEINLAICVKGTDKHIGNIYLHDIHWIARRARLEIFIGDRQERSKSYGQSAVRQLLCYAFCDLGLETINLQLLTDNSAALHIYNKIGFQPVGMLKKQAFKQGNWKDMILMSISADDYDAMKEYLGHNPK